jgi:hypothetical protein
MGETVYVFDDVRMAKGFHQINLFQTLFTLFWVHHVKDLPNKIIYLNLLDSYGLTFCILSFVYSGELSLSNRFHNLVSLNLLTHKISVHLNFSKYYVIKLYLVPLLLFNIIW